MSRDRSLGGRVGRGFRLARTGARGLTTATRVKARQYRDPGADDSDLHLQMAEQLADVLGEMKGAAMKLGQLLSFVDLDVPPEVQGIYHDALAKLRDNAPAFDPEAIAQVIHEEYGAPPEAVFASWDPVPLASASIGQVHAAKLDDGRDVVVKVQYPGVAEAVRADMRNVESFGPLARLINPHVEIEPLLEELRDRIFDELDYEREAQYQRAFQTRYAGHPFIHVPDVVADKCRKRVLVTERMHGRSFDAFVADSTDEQRQRVAEIIFRYSFGSIGRFRLFNADPHPGNYLIEDDGRVAFIDYGSVKLFSRERYSQMRGADEAVLIGDVAGFEHAMTTAGFLPTGHGLDVGILLEWFRLYSRPIVAEQPFTYTPEFAAEVISPAMDPKSRYFDTLRKVNLPPDYLLLNRIQWGINSVLGKLRATNDWAAIHDEYVHDGPPATELGELDHAWWTSRVPEVDPPA